MPAYRREPFYWGVILLLLGLGLYAAVRSPLNKSATPKPTPTAYDVDAETYTWETSDFVTGLEVPWDMAFDSTGQLFFTERPGRVKVRQTNGQVNTILNLESVASVGESGMTGMTLHPDFANNRFVYLYYTYRKSGNILNRVSRFEYKEDQLVSEKVLVDDIPGGSIHNGGRMRFGPDKKLYILTGDGGRPDFAQSKSSFAGKVLRANEDGSVPADNPFPGSLVFSLGHRNPQGLAWHPLTEELVVTEHGETAHDEINLVKGKGNYGWPLEKKCNSANPDFTNPILCSDQETWAPSGIAALGTKQWKFRYSFVFAGLRGNLLERIEIIDGKVTSRETILKGNYGRLRAVAVDAEGNVYVGTSNKDGRGDPKPGDDKIIKLTPKLKK